MNPPRLWLPGDGGGHCLPACERCVPPADRPLTCHGPAKNPADHGFCKRLDKFEFQVTGTIRSWIPNVRIAVSSGRHVSTFPKHLRNLVRPIQANHFRSPAAP